MGRGGGLGNELGRSAYPPACGDGRCFQIYSHADSPIRPRPGFREPSVNPAVARVVLSRVGKKVSSLGTATPARWCALGGLMPWMLSSRRDTTATNLRMGRPGECHACSWVFLSSISEQEHLWARDITDIIRTIPSIWLQEPSPSRSQAWLAGFGRPCELEHHSLGQALKPA